MKPIRSLYLLAIGMMVCTAHATTSVPEQKQNPTFESEQIVLTNVVNVDYTETVVLTAISKSNDCVFIAPSFQMDSYNKHLSFAYADVGWCETIKFTNSNQLNFILCHKKLEQNLSANQLKILNFQKQQNLELCMEQNRKTLILPNIHLTEQFKLASPKMRLHQMYLNQEKTTT